MRANEAPTVSSPLVPAATAILDRFLHDTEVITITGQELPLQEQADHHGSGLQESRKVRLTCRKAGK